MGAGSLREIVVQALAEHEGLVHWVVRRQWRGSLSYEEALHIGRIALWQALRHYDPRRGVAFSTYAVPAIARALWQAVAQAAPDPHRERMPQPPQFNMPPMDFLCKPITGLAQPIPFGEQHTREVKEKVGLWGRLRRPHNPTPHPFPTQGELLRKPITGQCLPIRVFWSILDNTTRWGGGFVWTIC